MSDTTAPHEKTFQESWAFPSELKKELKAARYYIERRLDGATFKSGREKWEARYYSSENGGLICRRDAMELISKKTGKPYHVVRRA